MISACIFGFAQQIVVHPAEINYPLFHDVSPPLSDLPQLQPVSGRDREEKEIPNRNFSLIYSELNGPVQKNGLYDAVLQNSPGILSPVSTIINREGISNNCGCIPPDPSGDVGVNNYIQAVNLSFAIYSKAGELQYGPASLSSLWQGFPGSYTSDGDPIVLYDHLADRWIITQFSLPNYPNGPYYELLAVSQTPDPLGAWHRYSFKFTKMPDYPKLGVWPDGYYMSVNLYSSGALNYTGPAAIVLERDSLLAGKTARMTVFELGSDMLPMLPADLDGQAPEAGKSGLFLSVTDEPAGSTDHLNLYSLHANWTDPSNAVFSGPQSINTAEFDASLCNGAQNCIPQPGTSRRLDPLTRYLMHRLQFRNFGNYQVIMANHTVDADGTDHAGIRWYELRTSDTIWSVCQQGTYAPDTNHRWIGSIAMDGMGNIALAYSVSGKGMYPSIHATGRRSGDIPGYMSIAEEPIMSGTGAQNDASSRWGDYSCLTVDPVDNKTFWYTNEYYLTTSTMDWKTRIASFSIDNLPVGISQNSASQKSSVFMLKNFPNPFWKSTNICWHLEHSAYITLDVYDYTGSIIRKIVDEKMNAGEHQVGFDASSLPAGIYFCQLRAGGMVETRKMIVTE